MSNFEVGDRVVHIPSGKEGEILGGNRRSKLVKVRWDAGDFSYETQSSLHRKDDYPDAFNVTAESYHLRRAFLEEAIDLGARDQWEGDSAGWTGMTFDKGAYNEYREGDDAPCDMNGVPHPEQEPGPTYQLETQWNEAMEHLEYLFGEEDEEDESTISKLKLEHDLPDLPDCIEVVRLNSDGHEEERADYYREVREDG